jgi:hypothetical protein
MVAIIRGSDGGRKMYDPTAAIPRAYNALRVETYRDRIDYPGSWNKQAVVAHENDADTMLAHSLIQAQTRFGIRPS